MRTSKPAKSRLTVAALVGAMALVGGFEGYRQNAYNDPVGIPTICFGATQWEGSNSKRPEECAGLLARDVLEAAAVLDCIHVPLSDKQQTALVSWAYNVGVHAACTSTLVRKANAGQEFCSELDRWVYAKGIKLRGLIRRRAQERELCEAQS